jgi:hypothetical protein
LASNIKNKFHKNQFTFQILDSILIPFLIREEESYMLEGKGKNKETRDKGNKRVNKQQLYQKPPQVV